MVGGYVIAPPEVTEITRGLEQGESRVVPGAYNRVNEYFQLGKFLIGVSAGPVTPLPIMIHKSENNLVVSTLDMSLTFIVAPDDTITKG